MASSAKENSPKLWRIPPLAADDHKYSRGHVLILGGETMTGAARLAALAAQRAGAGMVTLAANEKVWPIYASSLMSVITTPLKATCDWEWILDNRRISAVLLGPGCEPGSELREAILHAAERDLPLVLDAGALDVLAEYISIRKSLAGKPFVCLPHEGEYEKLARALRLDIAAPKPARTVTLAEKLGGIVVLKGDVTVIAAPNGNYITNKANAPQLATAGTGDVLAGMVAGLAAQGMELFDAAAAAVWVHAEAARVFGHGMIAEDLLLQIPEVLRNLSR